MCSFLVCKNACMNYREFDLEGDLVGVPHTWYLSAQSFSTLLKLVWREQDMGAMNDWKKKCVGLQWTWVSKRTVQLTLLSRLLCLGSSSSPTPHGRCWEPWEADEFFAETVHWRTSTCASVSKENCVCFKKFLDKTHLSNNYSCRTIGFLDTALKTPLLMNNA